MTSEAPLGLRERKKAEARVEIVAAALRLFQKRGYAEVTIDEIAALANVSRRTFFRYFPTKEDVVLERRREQLALFRGALGTLEGRPVDLVREAFALVAADYQKNKARILSERALLASARDLRVRDLEIDREFENAIVDAVVARTRARPADRLAARFFAAAAMGVVRVVVDDWAEAGGDADIAALGRRALDAIAELLPTP
ncbi:MAG: TetR family transcriptional regulator [Myxococcales bacterium]|nr:TetR family transcriptional regulator [Myxococcales bacterium]